MQHVERFNRKGARAALLDHGGGLASAACLSSAGCHPRAASRELRAAGSGAASELALALG